MAQMVEPVSNNRGVDSSSPPPFESAFVSLGKYEFEWVFGVGGGGGAFSADWQPRVRHHHRECGANE